MKQTTFTFADNDQREHPLSALDPQRKKQLVELMAQAIAAVLEPDRGAENESA